MCAISQALILTIHIKINTVDSGRCKWAVDYAVVEADNDDHRH